MDENPPVYGSRDPEWGHGIAGAGRLEQAPRRNIQDKRAGTQGAARAVRARCDQPFL